MTVNPPAERARRTGVLRGVESTEIPKCASSRPSPTQIVFKFSFTGPLAGSR